METLNILMTIWTGLVAILFAMLVKQDIDHV